MSNFYEQKIRSLKDHNMVKTPSGKNSHSRVGSCVDKVSLKIFVSNEEDVYQNQNKQKSSTEPNQIKNDTDSSSNCDEKEHLDICSVMAKDEENAKKCNGRCEFMTPKKEAKHTSDIDDPNIFQFNVENPEEQTYSANRHTTKNPNAYTKSYNSLAMPQRKASDNYSFNNLTFIDDNSDKNLMRELNVKGNVYDHSSGNMSTQMFNYNPDSLIINNKNPRSFNSTNNAVNYYNTGQRSNFSGDNKSSLELENNLYAQNINPSILNNLYDDNTQEPMFNNRRNTLNSDTNKNIPKQQVFVSKYDNSKRNVTKTRPRKAQQANFFRYNDSTLDSDKFNSHKSYDKLSSNKKNSQPLLNGLLNLSAIMKTNSGENIQSKNLLSNITPNQQNDQFGNISNPNIGNYHIDTGLEQQHFGNLQVNPISMVKFNLKTRIQISYMMHRFLNLML